MITAEKLKEIKQALPHGSLKAIADRAMVDYVTVYKFFKGQSQNPAVADAVIEEYREHSLRTSILNNCA